MNEDRIKWNNAAVDYQNTFRLGINDYNISLLNFWKDNGMIFPNCKVVDIGCGVGKYGTYFAELGYDVTLMDISDKMIEHARKNMSSYLTPWKTICCDFDELEIDNCDIYPIYDLAISTMSPAIHDILSVKKMSDITIGWCFIARFYEWNQPFRDKLLSLLDLKDENPFGSNLKQDCEIIFESIVSAGYCPIVKEVEYNWVDKRTIEEMADYMCRRYLPVYENMDEIRNKIITVLKNECDENGYANDDVNTKVKWIYWKAR